MFLLSEIFGNFARFFRKNPLFKAPFPKKRLQSRPIFRRQPTGAYWLKYNFE